MALWGNVDNAANSTIFALAQVSKNTASPTERTKLFGNTTPNAYFTGVTVGQFGIDVLEQQQSEASSTERPTHAGWVLRTEGSGLKAGRVFYETLVAMGSLSGDASNTILPQQAIVITSQPVNNISVSGAEVTYRVVVGTIPSGGTITYQWQMNGTNITTAGSNGFSGYTSNVLTVATPQAGVNNKSFGLVMTADGATTTLSSNVTIKVL